uniref:Reverse transcriptase domain-containing protein n=1 Tax=Kryptolebias marmoratus TaxID=37003 RepID=A0A3Q3APK6_KRYMA
MDKLSNYSLTLPQSTTVDKNTLDTPITTEEMTQAIRSMQNGKFVSKLVPFLRLFQKIMLDKNLPPTTTLAVKLVLMKKDKNLLDCGSYHPISLLCCD